MANSTKTECEYCRAYICKLKRHILQVHLNVSEEECVSAVQRSRISKKPGKQYFYCSFELEAGSKCNKPVTEEGLRHHLLRIHSSSVSTEQGRHNFTITLNTPVKTYPLNVSSTPLDNTFDVPCTKNTCINETVDMGINNELDVSVSTIELLPAVTRPSSDAIPPAPKLQRRQVKSRIPIMSRLGDIRTGTSTNTTLPASSTNLQSTEPHTCLSTTHLAKVHIA